MKYIILLGCAVGSIGSDFHQVPSVQYGSGCLNVHCKPTLKPAGLVPRTCRAPGWYVHICTPSSLGYIGWKKCCQKHVKSVSKACQHQCNSQSNNQCQSSVKLCAFCALSMQF